MIGREKRVLLRHYLEQGMNKAVIARDLGVSRRTVYHWIETGQLDRELDEERVGYGPRCLMPSKLDPYKPLIDTRLKEHPKLTAVRLFKEVRAAGYPGSYNQVKRYVRKVRPRPPEEPVVRFETAPGRQGQVDFAHFRLPWGKRYALIVVLGYSRLLWLRYYQRQAMAVMMRGAAAAFLLRESRRSGPTSMTWLLHYNAERPYLGYPNQERRPIETRRSSHWEWSTVGRAAKIVNRSSDSSGNSYTGRWPDSRSLCSRIIATPSPLRSISVTRGVSIPEIALGTGHLANKLVIDSLRLAWRYRSVSTVIVFASAPGE